ncbi:MAG: glycosyltransferase family 1 protein, partial [Chloroflexota bacterium]|nr:glycosyltransferase family 1 protein [Chloroflexota bacterium]
AALAAAIVGLLDDPERRARIGAAGRDAVFPEYDASTLVRRIDALYRGLAGSIKGSMVRNRS